jgi:hypothetical protein
MVITEVPICDKLVSHITHARGVRTVRWILAYDRLETDPGLLARDGVIPLPSTHYIHSQLALSPPTAILFSPLDRRQVVSLWIVSVSGTVRRNGKGRHDYELSVLSRPCDRMSMIMIVASIRGVAGTTSRIRRA